MDQATEILCENLRKAKKPEDVFGEIAEGPLTARMSSIKHLFNGFVRLIHPDRVPDLKDAGRFMERLTILRREAEDLLREGSYGKVRKVTFKAILRSPTSVYNAREELGAGEFADLYGAEDASGAKKVLKVVRKPSDNDLLDAEARTLFELHRASDERSKFFRLYLPTLTENFALIGDGGVRRKVNVFERFDGFYSLAQVREAYPDGIDLRDAAWMLRRVFEALGWIHSQGFVHGATLPENLLVHPEDHGAKIVEWSYAVRSGQRLLALSAKRRDMYPPGVFKKEPVRPVLDLQLTAGTGLGLLSDRHGNVRSDCPKDMVAFLRNCVSGAEKDAWVVYQKFDAILQSNYGKRKYRAFLMPPRV